MTATLCSFIFLAQSALGCGWGVPYDRAVVACVDACGAESAQVMALIQTLQCHPRRKSRDNAAHALRKFDWRCHPAILPALTSAMLSDPEKHVRKEAAQALTRIEPPPCTPEVHAALVRTADCDPSLVTRLQARRALKRIGRRCVDPCSACGPIPVMAPGSVELISAPHSEIFGMGSDLGVPPSTIVVPEPRLEYESDGLEPLPPPLPPGAIESFDSLPEARHSTDRPSGTTTLPSLGDPREAAARSISEQLENQQEQRRESWETEPTREPRRFFPTSILGRPGR